MIRVAGLMAGPVAGLVAGLVAVTLPLFGCGVRPTGTVYAGEAPIATGPASPQAQVYFLLQGVPTPVPRPVNPRDTQLVFDTLLAGPTPEERAKGLVSELTGIRHISVTNGGGTLIVETDPPVVRLAPAALTQLLCTSGGLPEHPVLKIPYMSGERPLACDGASSPPRSIPHPVGSRAVRESG
jgi:hypothetical protein